MKKLMFLAVLALCTAAQANPPGIMDVQEAGDAMCDLIEPTCTADWDGERCRVIRSLWRQ
jgi:hypothetical protein